MSIRGVSIKLENPHLVYFTGSLVTGTFNFTVTSPTHSAGVCVQLAGEGKTRVRVAGKKTGINPHKSHQQVYYI